MENEACNNGQPVIRKGRKKQVKGELDRMKHAEKKKRRLEKALATSAAIRAELEKKKLQKKEEQQRLDEEGAATAEAVAMHVLVGDDIDYGCKAVLNIDEGFKPWDFVSGDPDLFMSSRRENIQLLVTPKYPPTLQFPTYQSAQPRQTQLEPVKYSPFGMLSNYQKANHQHLEPAEYLPIGQHPNAYVSGGSLDGCGYSDWSFSYVPHGSNHYSSYTEPHGLGMASLHSGLQRMHI